jgi:uncharacterized protein
MMNQHRTTVWQAARTEDQQLVQQLLQQRADIEEADTAGRTALHWAALLGNEPLVRLLVEWRAEPYASDTTLMTPLHLAAMYNYAAIAKVLVDAGADVNALSHYGTPLHVAAAEGKCQVVSTLIGCGADVDASMLLGGTPLHKAASFGHLQVINALLDAGADIDAPHGGRQPLVAAMLLLQRNADASKTLMFKYGALHLAAYHGLDDLCRVLLRSGVSVNCRSWNHSTPLHSAAMAARQSVAELLIDQNADINVCAINACKVASVSDDVPYVRHTGHRSQEETPTIGCTND